MFRIRISKYILYIKISELNFIHNDCRISDDEKQLGEKLTTFLRYIFPINKRFSSNWNLRTFSNRNLSNIQEKISLKSYDNVEILIQVYQRSPSPSHRNRPTVKFKRLRAERDRIFPTRADDTVTGNFGVERTLTAVGYATEKSCRATSRAALPVKWVVPASRWIARLVTST